MPDWTMLFGYLVNQVSHGADPIVSSERKRIELPLAMTKRRDFYKIIRSQVLNPGTDQAQEILMAATQRGFVAFIRGDGRVSNIGLTDLMVSDVVYAPK